MLSERPWKPEAVMLLMSGLLFSLFLGMASGMLMQQFAPGWRTDGKFFEFLTNTVGFHGVALVLVTLFLKHHQTGWGEFLGWKTPRVARALALAIAVGVLVVPLALVLNKACSEIITWFSVTPEVQPTIKVLQVSTGLGQRLGFAVAAIVIAPVVEEVLFRGILYRTIKQSGRPRVALVATSLLFAAVHANLMTFVPLAFFGVVMVLIYEKTGTLLAPIVTHSFFNVVNFCLFLFDAEIGRWLNRFL